MTDIAERSVKKQPTATISVGVTWVDGRIIFGRGKKWGMFWYGACHYSEGIWAVTPLDYDRPTMISSIYVSTLERYCDKAHVCLNMNCELNQFDRGAFTLEFSDCGAFSLSLPEKIDKSTIWFNEDKWRDYWKGFLMKPEGGRLEFDEKAGDKIGI